MIDFDKLAKKAFTESSTIEDKNALWVAVFDLEQWHCISQGGVSRPYPFSVYLEEDKPVLTVFTDTERARKYALENELHAEEQDTLLISLPSDSAIDYFVQFEDNGIWGIWINPGEMGFYAPLEGLSGIRNHIENLKS
jgi:hypothetical protein